MWQFLYKAIRDSRDEMTVHSPFNFRMLIISGVFVHRSDGRPLCDPPLVRGQDDQSSACGRRPRACVAGLGAAVRQHAAALRATPHLGSV